MVTFISILRVIHIITAILMAWPFYALVAVNQRVRLGPPLGDRTDTYMENIIKNRTIPCFVFQATALISGFALIFARKLGLDALLTFPILGLKFLFLFVISGLLSYVHRNLQPKIDRLFEQLGNSPTPEISAQINQLRGLRKRMASVCMFFVFTISMLGVQSWSPFPVWLSIVLTAAIGLFTWHAYRSETPYGWV